MRVPPGNLSSRGSLWGTSSAFCKIEIQTVLGWPGTDALANDADDSVVDNPPQRLHDLVSLDATGGLFQVAEADPGVFVLTPIAVYNVAGNLDIQPRCPRRVNDGT